MSYGSALLYAVSAVVLFLAKNIKKDFANIPRKVLTDNLDDILIASGFQSADDLFAVTLAMLSIAEKVPSSEQVAAAASSLQASVSESEIQNSLFMPDAKAMQTVCRLAAQQKEEHSAYLEELSANTTAILGKVPTPAKIRGLSTAMSRKLITKKYFQLEYSLYETIHRFCESNNLKYWLLRCVSAEEEDGAGCPYMVLMKPEDMEQFVSYVDSGACTGMGIRRNFSPEPNIFSDAFLYKVGTIRENRWNLGIGRDNKELGVPILAMLPYDLKSFLRMRYRLANIINRVICQRRGYYVPTLTKTQKLFKLISRFTSTEKLEAFRDRFLKLADSNSCPETLSYLDLHHVVLTEINPDAVYTINAFDGICSVIDAPAHVFTQGKSLLNSFYKPVQTAYRICYSCSDSYVLRTPDVKLTKRVGFIRRIFRKIVTSVKSVIKRSIKFVRGTIKKISAAVREKLKPAKAKVKIWWKLFTGFFRGLGLCVSPQSRELKKYRNKFKGQRCFLIGNGPSLRAEDLDALNAMGEITFGCNFIHRIYGSTDWRPTFHFISDSSTVRTACWDIVRNVDERTTMVVRDFAYQAMVIKPSKVIIPHSISIEDYKVSNNFLAYHYISHATVMSMMLEAAMYMGFDEIYLIGVDATTSSDKGGNFAANYFTPDQRAKLDIIKRKVIKNYDVHARRIEIANRQKNVYGLIGEAAKKRGIHIYNATRGGALEAYERVNLDDIITK